MLEDEDTFMDEQPDDEEALKVFVQAILTILKPNEGVIVDVDGDKDNRLIIWNGPDPDDENNRLLIVTDDKEQTKLMKHGDLIWMHDSKEDAVNATIDDFIVKQEIEELTKGDTNEDIRPSK